MIAFIENILYYNKIKYIIYEIFFRSYAICKDNLFYANMEYC